jgi:transposase
MFLFAFVNDVEPTNNAAERALRHGALWRKMSHGPKSLVVSQDLGRIGSVVETCRQHDRGVWDFLTDCLAATAEGHVLSSLLTVPSDVQAA